MILVAPNFISQKSNTYIKGHNNGLSCTRRSLSLQNPIETMILYNDLTWGYREQTAGVDGVDWSKVDP